MIDTTQNTNKKSSDFDNIKRVCGFVYLHYGNRIAPGFPFIVDEEELESVINSYTNNFKKQNINIRNDVSDPAELKENEGFIFTTVMDSETYFKYINVYNLIKHENEVERQKQQKQQQSA